MILRNIRWRNAGPFGNKWQELDFSGKPGMHLLYGENGVGKSTIRHIIKAALYLDLPVSQGSFVNQINKSAEIIAEYESKGVHNKVEIGYQPNRLKLFQDKNPEPKDKGGNDALKTYIRDEVIDIPLYIYNNILSISIDDFKSFLDMKPKDARDIRDRIFGFHLLNVVLGEIRSDLYKLNQGIVKKEGSITALRSRLEYSGNDYKSLEEKLIKQNEEAVSQLKIKSEELSRQLTQLQVTKDSWHLKIKELEYLVKLISNEKIKDEINKLGGELEKQSISFDAALNVKVAINKELKPIADSIENINDTKKLNGYITNLNNIIINFGKISTNGTKLMSDIAKINESIENDKAAFIKLSNEQKESTVKINDLKAKLRLYDKNMCPTCNGSFDSEYHKGVKEGLELDLQIETTKLQQMGGLIIEYQKLGTINLESQKTKKESLAVIISKYKESLNYLTMISHDKINEPKSLLISYINKVVSTNDISTEFDSSVSEKIPKNTDIDTDIEALKKTLELKEAALKEQENIIMKLANESGSITTQMEMLTKSVDMNLSTDEKDDVEHINSIKTINEKLTVFNKDISDVEQGIAANNKELELIEDKTTIQSQLEFAKNSCDSLQKEIEEIEDGIRKDIDDRGFYGIVEEVLSDSGIKAYLLRDIIPAINSNVSDILPQFGVQMKVLFDEEFNTKVIRFGDEVDIKTISTGQKKIINFAIIISMVRIIMMKYDGSVNLIFFDELLSSLYPYNRQVALELMKKIFCEELGIHAIIVNHYEMDNSLFDTKIEVKSINDFSSLTITNNN